MKKSNEPCIQRFSPLSKKRILASFLSFLPIVSAAEIGENAMTDEGFNAIYNSVMVFGGLIVGVILIVLFIMLMVHLNKKKKEKGGKGETVDEYKIPVQQNI